MNPLTNVKNIQKLNEKELALGTFGKKSWHDEYKDSAWVFIGGLPYDLTEGDVICAFSQYGEVVNINLVRDKGTGKSKGFAFLCYEDQRSTVLAVDNLNSVKLLGRIIRVDHVHDYKQPKEKGDEDEVTRLLRAEGCAPVAPSARPAPPLMEDLDEPPTIRPPPSALKPKKSKKDKKKKKKKKKMKVTVKVERRSDSDSSSSSSSSESSDEDEKPRSKKQKLDPLPMVKNPEKLKQEKHDRGYERALKGHRKLNDRGRERESTDRGAHSDAHIAKRDNYEERRGEDSKSRYHGRERREGYEKNRGDDDHDRRKESRTERRDRDRDSDSDDSYRDKRHRSERREEERDHGRDRYSDKRRR